jgi:cyclopropane fatty-acyl-phospholipid synthase-like methyltransferase
VTRRAVPQRIDWAVRTVAATGAREVLEVGCGRGVAVRLLCGLLPDVRVTALDRSPAMTDAARRANEDLVAAGRLELRTASLADVDLGRSRFDAVFAVDVNVFWVGAARAELDAVRDLLSPGGGLHLFHEPPPGQAPERVREGLRRHLALARFAVEDLTPPPGAGALLGVRARPVGPEHRAPAQAVLERHP